jgi:hypothetical protein
MQTGLVPRAGHRNNLGENGSFALSLIHRWKQRRAEHRMVHHDALVLIGKYDPNGSHGWLHFTPAFFTHATTGVIAHFLDAFFR